MPKDISHTPPLIGYDSSKGNKSYAVALACSPRVGGNSDTLAKSFAHGFNDGLKGLDGQNHAGHANKLTRMDIVYLRDYAIKPCIACYACQPKEGKALSLSEQEEPATLYPPCPLQKTHQDQSADLFHILLYAPALYISAPIFFYHLPAHLKAFMDRGQSYWLHRMAHDPLLCSLPQRPAWISLIAGRKKGEKLFEGSMVSLRFFLHIFNFAIQDSQHLLGYDEADAVQSDTKCMEMHHAQGMAAARQCITDTWKKKEPI